MEHARQVEESGALHGESRDINRSGWRRWSMQDKWRKVEHCTERAETSTVWMEKVEHARQVEEDGALHGES